MGRGAAAEGRQRAEPAVWVGVAFGPEGRTAGPPRRGCCSRRRRVDAASRARARRAPSRASRQRPVNRGRGFSRSPPQHFPRSSRKPLGAGDTRATVSPRATCRTDLDHACDANGFEIPILTGAPRALRACGDPRTPKANLGEVTSVRSVASSEKKFNSGESLRGARREDDDDLASACQAGDSGYRRCREHGYTERRVEQEGHEAEESPEAPRAVRARGEVPLSVQGVQRLSSRPSAL